ncbi:SLAP domain-containing protein [Lactobacillus sp. ESL0701]|uniref:SLAP domain-containing protein n=1 Tax=Lactobacillus sp. ESL0701 TaxID=2983217 RepID=UPI0023F6A70E|nr:SLAP domain-containing protein [Lactobacillus sp. ESL0701]MDF7671840.1 SLAP domain-containing protein [Lactobacillus sp. ESL0701]
MKIKKLITTALIGVGLVTPVFGMSQTESVQAASINSLAKQNSYVGVTYLHTMLKTEGIKYNKFYANGNKIKYRNGKPEGIVIHETATPNATAYNEAIYFNREWMNMYAYVHAFVDHKQVIQMMTPKYGVWGAGAIANSRFFQIELAEENTRDNFAKSVNNDAIYAAKILHRYDLKPSNASNCGKGTIWSHHAVSKYLGGTNHTDPDGYFAKWGYSMDDFYSLVKYYYNLQGADSDADLDATGVSSASGAATDTTGVSQAPTGKQTLMHDAYTYNEQGERTSAALKTAGTKVTVAKTKTINGKKYLQIGTNEYVIASNIIGKKRTLSHNAYVYDTVGKKTSSPKLYRGNSVRVYGGQVTINGMTYYQINTSEFVKAANFK